MSVSPPLDPDTKAYLIAWAGDLNGVVSANIDLIWQRNAPYAPYPPLQEMYTQRESLTLLAGQVWQLVDASVDDTRQNLTDLSANLKQRLADLDRQIAAQTAMTMAALGLTTATGPLVTVVPVPPPPGYPDANSPRYSGSPYAPPTRVSG
jgi:hypothetical protein